jgi:hypothetical protein
MARSQHVRMGEECSEEVKVDRALCAEVVSLREEFGTFEDCSPNSVWEGEHGDNPVKEPEKEQDRSPRAL